MEVLSPTFRKQKEDQSAPLELAVSPVLSFTQSNQHTQVAYFGVTCSELFHLQNPIICIYQSYSLDTYTLYCIFKDHFYVCLGP